MVGRGFAFSSGGGAATWTLAEKWEVAGAAETQHSFTVDLDYYKVYRISGVIVGADNKSLNLFANVDETATNYYRQYLDVSAAVHSSGRNNDATIASIINGSADSFDGIITKIAGENAKAMFFTTCSDGVAIYQHNTYWTYSANTNNITALLFKASGANAIGIGTKILLEVMT